MHTHLALIKIEPLALQPTILKAVYTCVSPPVLRGLQPGRSCKRPFCLCTADRSPRVSNEPTWAAREKTSASVHPRARRANCQRGIAEDGVARGETTAPSSESLPSGALGAALMSVARRGVSAITLGEPKQWKARMTITQWAVVSRSGAVLYVYDFESDAQAAQEDHEGSTVVKLTGKME